MTEMWEPRDGVRKVAGHEKRVIYDTDACDLEDELRRLRQAMDTLGDVQLYGHVEGEKVGSFVVDGDELPSDARVSDLRDRLRHARDNDEDGGSA